MSEETVGSQGPWDIEHDDGEWHFFDQRLGAFIFFIAGACALTLLVMLFVRDYYWRHNGQSLCRFFRWRSPPQSNEDLHRDRAIAEELQRQLNQEERETERQAKRNDRRKWYESYMKPFTVVSFEKTYSVQNGIARQYLTKDSLFRLFGKNLSSMPTKLRIMTQSMNQPLIYQRTQES